MSPRPFRHAALTVLVAMVVLPAPATAYTLVLKTGARIEVVAAPRFDAAGWAVATMKDGRRLEIYRDVLSLSSTRAANRHAGRHPAQSRATASPAPARRRAPEQPPPTTRRAERDGDGKVWTQDDLDALRGANVSIAGTSAAGAEAWAPPPAPAGDELDETWWRRAASELNGRIASLERQIRALERQESSWEGYVVASDTFDTTVGQASARKLKEIRQRADAARDALRQARGERALLKERARRASVPPGWLR